MNNLELYESFRAVPQEAQKPIKGGRLKGMTDINPMWRIKTLTERFGPFGIGWYYVVDKMWIETSMAKDEVVANVLISLYYKLDGEWSMPCQGIGGSMMVASESKGLYVNDECYKMALTDAISVACKGLGIGADIYWQKDNTKYNDSKKEEVAKINEMESEIDKLSKTVISASHVIALKKRADSIGIPYSVIEKEYGVDDMSKLTEANYGDCLNKLAAEEAKRS